MDKRSTSRSQSRSQAKESSKAPMCLLHKFGDKAQSCSFNGKQGKA